MIPLDDVVAFAENEDRALYRDLDPLAGFRVENVAVGAVFGALDSAGDDAPDVAEKQVVRSFIGDSEGLHGASPTQVQVLPNLMFVI